MLRFTSNRPSNSELDLSPALHRLFAREYRAERWPHILYVVLGSAVSGALLTLLVGALVQC